jgi:hypothetical protein
MLEDVAMVSSYQAWAVGENGAILHWVDRTRPDISRRAYVRLARKQ